MSQSDEQQRSTDTDYSPEFRDHVRNFYIAAINRDLPSATEILQLNIGIVVIGEYQPTLRGDHLYHLEQHDIAEVLQLIRLKGDTVRLQFNGKLGMMAWEWAIQNNDENLLNIVLEKSTILNDPRRFSCAFRLGASGKITECLLEWVKTRDNYNKIIDRTLFDAVHEDNEAVVSCLIQNNANVNITDPGIPLSIAAERASPRMVNLLLQNNASVIAVDQSNQMAHEIAADRKSYNPDCKDAIEVSAILEDAFRRHESMHRTSIVRSLLQVIDSSNLSDDDTSRITEIFDDSDM